MIGNGPLHGFRVPPTSVQHIRLVADHARQVLEIGEHVGALNIGYLLERLTEYGITYDVLEESEMPHLDVEACCIPERLLICIREDVYIKACENECRARFTIIHEFGHVILGHQRTINREALASPPKTYCDSEWQANQFAAEFLMPLEVIKKHGISSPSQIELFFRVSQKAAQKRISQLNKRREI